MIQRNRHRTPRRWEGTGGFPFARDPSLDATATRVLWRPELLPHAVMLVPAPEGFEGAYRFEALGRLSSSVSLHSDGEKHSILSDADGAHSIWLKDDSPALPMAALVPLDETVLLRLAGLIRLKRRLDRHPAGALPSAWQITARFRKRLLDMIRALDGHLQGASYREVARALYGPEAVGRFPWKTSSVRGQTIRLVADAMAMMDGGYRKLLRASR